MSGQGTFGWRRARPLLAGAAALAAFALAGCGEKSEPAVHPPTTAPATTTAPTTTAPGTTASPGTTSTRPTRTATSPKQSR